MIGCAPPAPLRTFCRPEVKEDRELVWLGRLRNVLQALVFLHRSSSELFMVLRYASRPLRRCSVSSGDDVVRVNHDFPGSETGGAVPASAARLLWRLANSEYRFCNVKDRRGRRRVML